MSIPQIVYPTPIKNNRQYPGITPRREQREQQSLFQAPSGQVTTKDQAFSIYESKIQNQNSRVIAHEEAHKNAAGPQAVGSPHYDAKTDADGRKIITGGHQMINVPGLIDFTAPKDQIEKTKTAAQYAVAGAEAPASFDELSGADKSVAAKGRAVLSSAQAAQAKRSEVEARIKKTGQNPDGELTPEQVKEAESSGGKPKQPAAVGEKINFMA